MKLKIPEKKNLIPLKHTYIDYTIDQYYRPFQGYFMRKRLELAFSMLGRKKFDKILDVGYGGGTFVPMLAKVANKVYGIDTIPDKQMKLVKQILKREGVDADLIVGSIFKSPYKDNFFDGAVCISVLEHFKGKELNKAVSEMYRVLKPGGTLVMGFPVKNPMTDFIIDHFLSFDPNDIHPSGHKQILSAINEEVKIEKRIHYFPFLPLDLSLYCVVRVKKSK